MTGNPNHDEEGKFASGAQSKIAKSLRNWHELASGEAFDYENPNLKASDLSMRMAELRKVQPRPIHKLWNDPSKAPPDQVEKAKEKLKAWQREYNKASKLQKKYLERDNAEFRRLHG